MEKEGIKFDRRNKLKVITDLRSQGVDAYPFAKPRYIYHHYYENAKNRILNTYFPVAGISHVTNVECNESGEWLVFKSDRYGFNNDDNVYKNNSPEFILIGDSFAFGSCVQRSENTAGQLIKKGHSVINMGVTGAGPLGGLAALKEYGPKLKPKSVVWLYFNGNDLRDLLYEMEVPILMKYLNESFSQNLITKQQEIDLIWKKLIKEYESDLAPQLEVESLFTRDKLKRILILENLRKLLGLQPQTLLGFNLVAKNKTLDLFKSILSEPKLETKKWGGDLFFVFLPSRARRGQASDENYEKVKAVVRELEIPMIDFRRYLYKMRDPSSFYNLGLHYNIKGYELLADFILKETVQR